MRADTGKWDGAAADYQKVFALGINEYNVRQLRFWQERGMIASGCRVLDIGCGVGKYGVYLAQLGCDVTLIDISAKMIECARRNMAAAETPWRALCCDFDEVTGAEDVFASGFDFAISTMSPAVHDAATVRKMSRMTHGWCFITRFYDWRQPFRDELMAAVGLIPRPAFERDLKTDCAELISAVRAVGYAPTVDYVDYCWADRRTVGEMADYMRRNYFPHDPHADALHEKMCAHLRQICYNDGTVSDSVSTKVARIYWKTEELAWK